MKFIYRYLLGAFIIGMFILICVQYFNIRKLSRFNNIQSAQLSLIQDSIKMIETKNGSLIAKINSIEVDKRNLKDALTEAGFNLSEIKDENIKLKNLNFALQAEIKDKGTIITSVEDTFDVVDNVDYNTNLEIKDTLHYLKINDWSDGRLSLYGGIIKDSKLSFKQYDYRIGLKFYLDEQRNKTTVTVKLDSDNATVVTANSIVVDKKKSIFNKWWLWAPITFIAGGIILN